MRTKLLRALIAAALAGTVTTTGCNAHFGMIIPSTDNVSAKDNKEFNLFFQVIRLFGGGAQMQLGKPTEFRVVADGKADDLLSIF